jgi:hypothetical protein
MRFLHSEGLISSGIKPLDLPLTNSFFDVRNCNLSKDQIIMASAISMAFKNCESLTGKIPSKKYLERKLANNIIECFFFLGSDESIGKLVAEDHKTCSISIYDEHNLILDFEFSHHSKSSVNIKTMQIEKLVKLDIIYLPDFDFISTFTGFQGALENRELEFSKLYLHILKKLSGVPLKQYPAQVSEFEKYFFPGTITFNGYKFLYKKNNKIIQPHIAGYITNICAIYIWLIKNGGINKDTILFSHDCEHTPSAKITISQIIGSMK